MIATTTLCKVRLIDIEGLRIAREADYSQDLIVPSKIALPDSQIAYLDFIILINAAIDITIGI